MFLFWSKRKLRKNIFFVLKTSNSWGILVLNYAWSYDSRPRLVITNSDKHREDRIRHLRRLEISSLGHFANTYTRQKFCERHNDFFPRYKFITSYDMFSNLIKKQKVSDDQQKLMKSFLNLSSELCEEIEYFLCYFVVWSAFQTLISK